MSYRSDARKRLSQLTLSPPRHPQPTIGQVTLFRINRDIDNFLTTPKAWPIYDFAQEYGDNKPYQYGYLYDHIENLAEINPMVRASANRRSQSYCLRITLGRGYGHIFAIPLFEPESVAIVLKPARILRSDRLVGQVSTGGFPITLLLPPFENLRSVLADWAFSIAVYEYHNG